ncbi:hypothetical protein M5K25_005600 [Dendrobium thyrsiflorum]|uniref:Uncharacterized protein n=1 Tax=Dendrobium thyrsiflorum TaxID=117978 RepID=A0ABD0VIB9_DENTH
MEEQMRLCIRLAMEDSGFHLHTSMDNNIHNLIKRGIKEKIEEKPKAIRRKGKENSERRRGSIPAAENRLGSTSAAHEQDGEGRLWREQRRSRGERELGLGWGEGSRAESSSKRRREQGAWAFGLSVLANGRDEGSKVEGSSVGWVAREKGLAGGPFPSKNH